MTDNESPTCTSQTSAPDLSSVDPTELHSHGGSGDGLGYDLRDGFRLSAKTCLALLSRLSEQELDEELDYLAAYYPDLANRTRIKGGKEAKQNFLQFNLFCTLQKENDKIVKNINLLLRSVSDLKTTKHDTDIGSPDPAYHAAYHNASLADNLTAGNVILPSAVSKLDVSFSSFNVDDVIKCFNFTTKESGNRSTCYFGAHSLEYGRTKHRPQPYPDSCPLFNDIFSKIYAFDSTFKPKNFTCLVTLYPNGNSYIPLHSDDEISIAGGSNIYTVSLGSKRTLNFINQVGKLKPEAHEFDHGSVYVMTAESQNIWKHEIRPEPHEDKPRISLTFRHIPGPTDGTTTPDNNESPSESDSPKRVLFLTDSILSGTPPHIISPQNHIAVKKVNYQLENIFNFEPEFKFTDQVVISAGVNDLHKFNHTAESLADTIARRLRNTCAAHPKTHFLFNSLLLTKFDWLNREIDRFNDYMFDICKGVHNLTYFDSHAVLKTANLGAVLFPSERNGRYGNGVHITFEARKAVTRALASKLRSLASVLPNRQPAR